MPAHRSLVHLGLGRDGLDRWERIGAGLVVVMVGERQKHELCHGRANTLPEGPGHRANAHRPTPESGLDNARISSMESMLPLGAVGQSTASILLANPTPVGVTTVGRTRAGAHSIERSVESALRSTCLPHRHGGCRGQAPQPNQKLRHLARQAVDHCRSTLYTQYVIGTFRHRGLKELYEQGRSARVTQQHLGKLLRILTTLDQSSGPEGMDVPGFRLHPLRAA